MNAPLVECALMSVVIVRMIASRSVMRAVCGSVSQMRMPGTFVAMDLKVPRISSGASGFGSNVSCCGGPPLRKMITHDFARPNEADFCPGKFTARTRCSKSPVSDIPRQPSPPTRSHSRRCHSIFR